MKKAEKRQQVEQLSSELADVRHAVLLNYKGITVPAVTALRAQVRQNGGSYRVVKNRLLKRAVADAPLGKLEDSMVGPTALAWSADQPVALAKTLTQFAKTAPAIEFKGVLLDGEPIPVAELAQVASLPSIDELRAKVVGLLVSPMRRMVTAMADPARKLATVMKQKADKG